MAAENAFPCNSSRDKALQGWTWNYDAGCCHHTGVTNENDHNLNSDADNQMNTGMQPEHIEDGREVIYYPSPSIACHGFIDGKPWQLGDGSWVVRLKNMDPSYAQKTGKLGGRDWVNAASLHCIEYAY